MNIETLIRKAEELKTKIEKDMAYKQAYINAAPGGKLTIASNGCYDNWYVFDKGKGTKHLPKSERKIAEQLAVKTYYMECLKDDAEHLKAINFFLNHYRDSRRGDQFLNNHPKMIELMKWKIWDYDAQTKELLNRFPMDENFRPDEKIIDTRLGFRVRSKTEREIAHQLANAQIPFTYEPELEVNGRYLHPDFRLIRPSDRRILLWLHGGMMDNPNYRRAEFDKLGDYIDCGFLPGVNLITTYETKDMPLSVEQILAQIELYLL